MVLAELGQKLSTAMRNLADNANTKSSFELQPLLNEIGKALLEADVFVSVVKTVLDSVRKDIESRRKASGLNQRRVVEQAVFNAVQRMLDPGAVAFEPRKAASLVKSSRHQVASSRSQVVMFVGMQGSGKTTSCTKYARHYQQRGLKTAIICADTFRAGALDQLRQYADKIQVRVVGSDTEPDPVIVAREGVKQLKEENYDLIVVDTSGKHQQDEALFAEMKTIESVVQPNEIIFVMDATNGQGLYAQALRFKQTVAIGSVVVTKLDSGTAKGGGALSAVAATKSPIAFIGTGEHLDEWEKFDPRVFVNRMLGFGDWGAFVRSIMGDEKKAKPQIEAAKRLMKGQFTMRDMIPQLDAMSEVSMGNLMQLAGNVFGSDTSADNPSLETEGKEAIAVTRIMLRSFSSQELDNPQFAAQLRPDQVMRITRGSGRSLNDFLSLLATFTQIRALSKEMAGLSNMNRGKAQKMAQQMQRGGGRGGALGNIQQMMRNMDPAMMQQMAGAMRGGRGGGGRMQGLMNMAKQMGMDPTPENDERNRGRRGRRS